MKSSLKIAYLLYCQINLQEPTGTLSPRSQIGGGRPTKIPRHPDRVYGLAANAHDSPTYDRLHSQKPGDFANISKTTTYNTIVKYHFLSLNPLIESCISS